MKRPVKQAKELLIKAIQASGTKFARSLYRRAPNKKVLPLLGQARGLLLDTLNDDPNDTDAIRLLAQVEEEFYHFSSAIRYLEQYLSLTKNRDKKVLQRIHRLREHQKEAALLPISTDQLADLGQYIEVSLDSQPCDHTLRNAVKWATENGIDEDRLVKGLQERGGYCDCEVLFNVIRQLV